jgi:thiol-disulfide isomerase/thioredoxin
MLTRKIILLSFTFLLSFCGWAHKFKAGTYRGLLLLNEAKNIELPFNFEVSYKKRKPHIIIRNGEERIIVDEISISGDSVKFKMPLFDTEFKCKLTPNGLEGIWINNYRKEKNIIQFKAFYNNSKRFDFELGSANPIFEGKWEVTFSPTDRDSSKAIGIFHHLEQTDFLSGTFLTETGDYRFLEGMRHEDKMYLSCFDGSHAFLFIAQHNTNGQLSGKFYSGAHWEEDWTAKRNPEFELRKAEELTFAKNKGEKINFSFNDLDNNKVSLSDKKFENKPVIIQVMGSWCPNCADESAYLAELYQQYKHQGLEIIAIAYEKTNDPEKAKAQVRRLTNKLGIAYTVLLPLQVGKTKAGESLPFLNGIMAFPTTVFLNKAHQIVRIHTGFSGPATGKDYLSFKESTEALIRNLLKE